MRKVRPIFLMFFLFVAFNSLGQEKISFTAYSNSGEKLDEFYSIEKGYKYLVIAPDKVEINYFTTKLTHVSNGLGKKKIEGDKVIKLSDEFIKNLKADDYLSIEVLNKEKKAIHFINLKVTD